MSDSEQTSADALHLMIKVLGALPPIDQGRVLRSLCTFLGYSAPSQVAPIGPTAPAFITVHGPNQPPLPTGTSGYSPLVLGRPGPDPSHSTGGSW